MAETICREIILRFVDNELERIWKEAHKKNLEVPGLQVEIWNKDPQNEGIVLPTQTY
jgi:hypothetical protein